MDKKKEIGKRDQSNITDYKKSELAELQENVDTARDKVNALMKQKLSLDSALQDLINSGAQEDQITPLKENIKSLMEEINNTSRELANALILAESAIAQARDENRKLTTEIKKND